MGTIGECSFYFWIIGYWHTSRVYMGCIHILVCVCAYVHICLHTVVKGTYAYTVRNKSVYVASCLDNYFSWCSL